MHSFSTTPTFDKQLSKMDPEIQRRILKRMQKIIDKPELGKPLHAPLQNHFSERILRYRVIYTFTAQHVIFRYLDNRDHVYEM